MPMEMHVGLEYEQGGRARGDRVEWSTIQLTILPGVRRNGDVRVTRSHREAKHFPKAQSEESFGYQNDGGEQRFNFDSWRD